jgi:O-antigen ligase
LFAASPGIARIAAKQVEARDREEHGRDGLDSAGPGRFTRALNAIVFWGLLAALPLTVFPYGTVDPWFEAAFECLIFSLAIVWVLQSIFSRGFRFKRRAILLPMIAITLYVFFQSIEWPPTWLSNSTTQHMLSIDHYQTYLTARKTLALALLLGLLLAHTSTSKRLQWVVRTVIAVGLASAIFGILRQFLQTPDAAGTFILPFLFYGSGYGQFISPNAFAYLMEMTLGLVMGLLLGGGTLKKQALVYIAMSAILFTALVLSNSRGGLLALGCESIFVLFIGLSWYSQRRIAVDPSSNRLIRVLSTSKLVRTAVVGLLLVILSGGVLWLGGDSLVNKFADQSTVSAAAPAEMTRQQIWRASWSLFRAYPWTGTGFGAYSLGITKFEKSSGLLKLEEAHNDYLDLAASGGLVGVCLGGWFAATVCWQAKQSFAGRRGVERAVALGAAAGMLATAVHSLVDFGLQLTGIAVVFVALAVILTADVPAETKKSRRRRHSINDPDISDGIRSRPRPVSRHTQ